MEIRVPGTYRDLTHPGDTPAHGIHHVTDVIVVRIVKVTETGLNLVYAM
jgi:hypothetical protein